MDYAGRYNLRASTALRNRFVSAIEEIAAGLLTEDPATPNHASRVAWARAVVKSRGTAEEYADMALRLAVHNAGVQAAGEHLPDSAIQTICGSLLASFAAAVSV